MKTTLQVSRRKAAVLLASLDSDTAEMLLAGMSQAESNAVRAEIDALGELDLDEQAAVLVEFFRSGSNLATSKSQSADKVCGDPPGLELNDELAAELRIAHQENAAAPGETAAQPSAEMDHEADHPPFEFLHDAEPAVVVGLLHREHPQAIALVLSHLPPHRASQVLAALAANTQAEVVRRLVELEQTDSHVVRDLERVVAGWLRERHASQRPSAGIATVSAILHAADGAARRQILGNLSAHDRRLAQRLSLPTAAPKLTFLELASNHVDVLAAALESASHSLAALALAGTPVDVWRTILKRMSGEQSAKIAAALADVGPMRLVDIQRAQSEIARQASNALSADDLSRTGAERLTVMA